jgi:hypothetical protein
VETKIVGLNREGFKMWIEGIQRELERTKTLIAASRSHVILEVPAGFSLQAHVEQVPKTGGERVHIMILSPWLQKTEL